jgi:2-methylcitrate dehydratase PrpD
MTTLLPPVDSMSATKVLAAFASSLSYNALPIECINRARMFILDAIGIMLAAESFSRANGDNELESFLREAIVPGKATVVGYGMRTSPGLAAFANGTLSEVLDCQDTNLAARMHNGTAAIPAVLALAEINGSPGRDIITAIIAGYEVGARLSLAIQPSHWHRGFQCTGTIGCSGAAAAAGRLLGFDETQMANCLGISGFIMPVSNSDNFFKGYSIKPVHGGAAAQRGIESVQLTRAGFEAGPLEGEPPRYHAVLRTLSDGEPDLAKCLADLGSEWHSLEVAFKPYPVGLLNVGPIQLCLSLRNTPGFSVDQVESVDVATYKEAALFTGQKYTTPETGFIECHLSMPFCVAAALTEGRLTPQTLMKDRISQPDLHELASRVRVVEDPEMSAQYPRYWPAAVCINMRDGTVLSDRVVEVDWSPRRPATWDALCEKFLVMAEPSIGPDNAARAIDMIAAFENLEDITNLMRAVSRDRQ